MKARSVIFTHTQFPMTIFGLPPLLTMASLVGGAVGYIAAVLLGAVPVALLVAALVSLVGLGLTYRFGRRDRHVESVSMTAFGFWKGFSSRALSTGAPALTSHRGGRK